MHRAHRHDRNSSKTPILGTRCGSSDPKTKLVLNGSVSRSELVTVAASWVANGLMTLFSFFHCEAGSGWVCFKTRSFRTRSELSFFFVL